MDAETQRIWEMIGALSDDFFHRANLPTGFLFDVFAGDYRPESDEERAMWDKLTAPENYDSLLRYVEYWKNLGTDLVRVPRNSSAIGVN